MMKPIFLAVALLTYIALSAQTPAPITADPAADVRSSLVVAEYTVVGIQSEAALRPALSCASATVPRSADVAHTAHCHARFQSAHRRATAELKRGLTKLNDGKTGSVV